MSAKLLFICDGCGKEIGVAAKRLRVSASEHGAGLYETRREDLSGDYHSVTCLRQRITPSKKKET